MRIFPLVVAFLAFPSMIFAQEIPIPLKDLEHAITFMKFGGTYAEAQDLAAKLTQEAQAQIDKLNAPKPPPEPAPSPTAH